MSRNTWVEISCDNCGCADHVKPGNVDAVARSHGWIVSADKKDFCSNECRKEYRGKHCN